MLQPSRPSGFRPFPPRRGPLRELPGAHRFLGILPWLLLAAGGCGREPLLHGLDEAQVNEILVALEEGGVAAARERGEGPDGAWSVTVQAGDAGAARRILSERQLPRPRPPGLGDVFGEAGMVPTPVEEHARLLHALSGELSRSLEALDGVVQARVHLGLPQEDPLAPGVRRPGRAAVLLRCRPAACDAVRALEPGIRSLVAGVADGLAPDAVAVLIAEASAGPPVRPPPPRLPAWRRWAAALLAGGALLAALASMRHRIVPLLRRAAALVPGAPRP